MAFWSKTSAAANTPSPQRNNAPDEGRKSSPESEKPSLASRMSTIEVTKAQETENATPPLGAIPPDPTAPEVNGQAQDQQRQAALASKMMMAAYGEIVSVLSRSPHHRSNSLADLEWLAVPAVMTGQFSLAEAQLKGSGLIAPIGLVMWAHVSAEVDQRLAENIATGVRLKPDEWRSGNILWLVDAVGEGSIVEAMIKRLVATEWKGREARMRARTNDGSFKVGIITSASPDADKAI